MNLFPGTVVSRSNFCTLLNKSWGKAMTAENIQSGFRACGIFPFNPSEVPADAYLPNSVYSVTQLLENRELLDTTADDQLPVAQDVTIEAVEIETATEAAADVCTQCPAYDLADYLSDNPAVVATIKEAIPPQQALDALLSTISEPQLAGYSYCYSNNIPLPDSIFQLWKCLKDMICQVQSDAIPADLDVHAIANDSFQEFDISVLLSGSLK